MDLLAGHPYLLSALLGVPGVLVAIAMAGRHRGSVLLAGLIETLHAPPLIWFDGSYWTPQRLGGLPVGVEDVIVSFSLGAGVWFAAILPFRRRLDLTGTWERSLVRLVAIGVGGALLALPIWLAGAGVMTVLLVVMLVVALVLGAARPGLLPLSLAALVLYPAYYVAILFLAAALDPSFFAIWDGPELWGPRLFGLPIEEIAFVAMFSITYPLIVGFALDARLDKPAALPLSA